MIKKHINSIIFIVGLSVVFFILSLTVKIPYTIKAPCQIVGQKEWALIQVEPDKILSKIYDNRHDRIVSFTLLQFAREDFIQFNQSSNNDRWIAKDEPLANIISLENKINLANLAGELDKARENLAIVSAGEKISLQEEAQNALKLAEIQYAAFEPQYQRSKELYESNLISASEWEISRATYDGLISNIALQKARVEVMKTGEKVEMLRYMKAQIEQIDSQLKLMKTKMALGKISSPFDGLLSYPNQDSIICLVENVDTIFCKIPFPAAEYQYVAQGQAINIHLFETGERLEAEVLSFSNRSKIINGRPSYVLTGYIESISDAIKPGMTGIADIHCESITLMHHLIRSFNKYSL